MNPIINAILGVVVIVGGTWFLVWYFKNLNKKE